MDDDIDMDMDTSTSEKTTLTDEDIEMLANYMSFIPEPPRENSFLVELVFSLLVVMFFYIRFYL